MLKNSDPARGILVPRAYDPSGLRQESRALGATISGMRHRCRCAVSRITRIRLFPLLFQNGCSQSSRFPTAGQRERGSGNEIGPEVAIHGADQRSAASRDENYPKHIWALLIIVVYVMMYISTLLCMPTYSYGKCWIFTSYVEVVLITVKLG